MIRIENTEVGNFEAAIRGMRNPMNSWVQSDSEWSDVDGTYHIGEKDLELMRKLVSAGNDHSKFMRMITVAVDVTAPMYWWAEADTYKVGTVRDSCSKMHKLLSKPFEMSDFSFDKLPGFKNEIKQFRPFVDEETEIWKKYNEDYDVSNYGRIRRKKRILSGSLHKDGYIFVTLYGKQTPLHRIIASVFIENPDSKKEVNHKDGNKQNNFVENLEWVTRSENQRHAADNNLQPKPVNKYTGKFTEDQRKEIKTLWDSGESKRKIAEKFGVSHTCICDITNDKYKYAQSVNLYKEVAKPIVDMLNELRDSYFSCESESDKKKIWYSILQILPESYNQRSTLLLNYQVLRNMYHARKEHKLDEWRAFCSWIEELPYSELITMKKGD